MIRVNTGDTFYRSGELSSRSQVVPGNKNRSQAQHVNKKTSSIVGNCFYIQIILTGFSCLVITREPGK